VVVAADAGRGAGLAIDEPQPARATATTVAQGRVVRWRTLMSTMVIHGRLTAVGPTLRLR